MIRSKRYITFTNERPTAITSCCYISIIHTTHTHIRYTLTRKLYTLTIERARITHNSSQARTHIRVYFKRVANVALLCAALAMSNCVDDNELKFRPCRPDRSISRSPEVVIATAIERHRSIGSWCSWVFFFIWLLYLYHNEITCLN